MINLYSQDIIDPPRLFDKSAQNWVAYTGHSIYLPDKFYTGKDFLLAWNWGNRGEELDKVLNIKYYHGYLGYINNQNSDTLDVIDNSVIIENLAMAGGRQSHVILNAFSAYYEPTLTVDTTNNFTPRVADKTGAVFGWRGKSGGITYITDTNSTEYHRVHLLTSNFNGEQMVLWNVWQNNLMHYLNYPWSTENPDYDPDVVRKDTLVNGERIYLSINMHTIGDIQSLNDDEVVLKIRLPYQEYSYLDSLGIYYEKHILQTRYAFFDAIPNTDGLSQTYIYNIIGSRGDSRGYTRHLKYLLDAQKTSIFKVTAKMLKGLLDPNGNITLSAHLTFNKTDGPLVRDSIENPRLMPDWYEHYDVNYYIKKLDVEVYYTDKIDLAIDYIKLETPQFRALSHGKYDTTMKRMVFNYLDSLGTKTRHGKVFRFYGNDEIIPGLYSANRYFNMFVDTLAALETFVYDNPAAHYLYATGFKEYWNGTNINWHLFNAAPYYKTGMFPNDTWPDKNVGLLNHGLGYEGLKKVDSFGNLIDEAVLNSLNSGYETILMGLYDRVDGISYNGEILRKLPSQTNWNIDSLNSFYNSKWGDKYFNTPMGTLYNVEQDLFHLYKDKYILFNNKPWYANLWVIPEGWGLYNQDTPQSSVVGLLPYCGRPITDCELNLEATMPLILGAKGIFYYYKAVQKWGKANDGLIHTDMVSILGLKTLDQNSTKTGLSYVLDDSIGGDYIKPRNDAAFKDHYIPNSNYNFAELGVDSNHIFIGTKSVRLGIYKVNKYIKAIENDLLNLNLVCWLGVGHRKWYVQDPAYGEPLLGDTLLNSFCISNSIKTRKLWQPLLNQQGYVPTSYEPDSSDFFDLTILKKKDVELATSYIMGISNRRTDQLIHTYSIPNDTWQLDYVPSSLFDTLCKGPDATYWKSMIWQKLGCREISICMKDTSVPQNTEIAYRITELGYDNDSLRKEYWFNTPYNLVIDTNLLYGHTLRICLQPGQTKLLNVEVVTTTDVALGDLDYSNQTKLVAFPCDSNYNANDTASYGKVRYHMVYGRRSSQSPSYCNVYYRRSIPMNRFDKLDKDNDWEAEQQLNDTLLVYDCEFNSITVRNLTSNYPSLVVRCDTIDNVLTPMVYVVYQASGEACPDTTKIKIIENVFPANTTTTNIPWGRQIGIASAKGDIISKNGCHWGVPVINASAHGNYYSWNDSLAGIVAGFKPPGRLGWIPDTCRTSFHGMPTFGDIPPNAFHPSLNTYSTISANEMDCALVWEESPNTTYRNQLNQIFYTRLKYCSEFGLVHYLSPSWGHIDPWYQKAIIVDNGRIARLDDPLDSITYHHLPMIHRDVDYYDAVTFPEFNGMHSQIQKNDRVYWQGRLTLPGGNDLQGIYMKFISIGDSLGQDGCIPYRPYKWLVEGTPAIMGTNTDLAHPNVAQGKLVKQYHISGGDTTEFFTFDHVVNDSVAVINFVEYPHNANPTFEVPRTSDIWQINHSYFSLFYGPNNYIYHWDFAGNAPNAHKIGSKGKYSHLARLPYINNDKTWEYGHRIFESALDPFWLIPTIKSYDYLLCKKSYEKDKNYQFFGFVDTCGNRTLLSPIYLTIDGREHAIIPKLDKEHKIYNDTLYSDWFEIGSYQDIDMLHFGSNKKCLDLKLQRKDNNKFYSVQTDKLSERLDYTKHSIHILNGKSKQYRFAWIKKTKSTLNEMTILGLPPMNEMTKDELLGKTSINVDENYLDLSEDITSEIPEGSSLYIYPNPANEKVVIFYEQENKSKINISIYGMLGTTIRSVFTGYIEKGKYQYSVNTKDIPAGIYFVRVEGNNKTIVKKLVME
jgi:hypothetical protein